MAIKSTSTNYSDRTVDLCLYPNLSTSKVPVPAQIIDKTKAISGISKTAQNFTRILLTPLGHYRSSPELGSDFLSRIVNGEIKFDVDLLHVFASESLRVKNYMSSFNSTTTPLDEQIDAVTMVQYSALRGSFKMTIELSALSGDSTTFLLPVIWSN